MSDPVEYTIKYPPYSVVCSIAKAKIGKIEKICVKTYRILVDKSTFEQPVIIYKDTVNFLWNEDELCTHSEAISLATAYLELVLSKLEE